jgi:hypothetical protein
MKLKPVIPDRVINESRLYGHKGGVDGIDDNHLWRPDKRFF